MKKQRGGEIKKISDLFEKYKRTLKAPQGHVVSIFCDVVDDVLNIRIDKERVKYTLYTRTISLQVQGPIKTEIILRKKEICTHLKGRLGEQNAPKEII